MNRLVPLLLATILSTVSFAQDEISKAKDLIRDGKCSEAIESLQKISKSKFSNHVGAKASVLLAECYLREGKKAEAFDLAYKFTEYHTTSEYRERMELIRAIGSVEKGSVYEGVQSMLRILAYTQNPAAKTRTKDVLIQTLAASLLTADQLQMLLEMYPLDKDIIGWLQLQIGRENQNSGHFRGARYWYRKVTKSDVSESLISTAQKGLESLEGKGDGKPTILVLAPLTGSAASFGIEAVQGVSLALEEANLANDINIRLADTKADPAIALMRTQQAINQDSIIAIIGPIMSNPAITVAAWLGSNVQNIPMITPTANSNDIAKLGPNIFQVNVTMDYLANSIADFAVKCLDIQSFSILSPATSYGMALSQSFSQSVERRGGKIVTLRPYEEGLPQYKTELDLLRDAGFKQANRQKNIEKGVTDLDAADPAFRNKFMHGKFKIPGLFLPAQTPNDAGLMVGQIAYNNIETTLLGSSGWYGRDFLVQSKNLAEGSYFSVPAMNMDENQEGFQKFAEAFKKKWGIEPGSAKVSSLSYDAANIVLTTFKSNPANMAEAINNAGTFKGIYGDIIFTRGVNTNAKIITVKDGKFELVESCEAVKQLSKKK